MTDDPDTQGPELIDEIDHGSEEYSDAELLEQAQLNAQAMLLGTVEILSEHPDILERWRRGLAEIFIRSWDAGRSWPATAILDALLTNYRSFGAVVVELDQAADPPTARIATLPDPLLVAGLKLDPEHIRELLMIGALLAEHLGGTLDWTLDAETRDLLLSVRSTEEPA